MRFLKSIGKIALLLSLTAVPAIMSSCSAGTGIDWPLTGKGPTEVVLCLGSGPQSRTAVNDAADGFEWIRINLDLCNTKSRYF